MDWLKEQFEAFSQWLLDAIFYVFYFLFDAVIGALITLLELIPVPGFFNDLQSVVNALPSGVLYFAQVFELNAGFSIIVSSYVIRFIIRRLPVVG